MIGNLRLIPGRAPVYIIAAMSICGALFFSYGSDSAVRFVMQDQWSIPYLVLSPFIHAGAAHALLNILGLHYIGGEMLLPILGARRFVALFALSALAGGVINNLLGSAPAVGISATVLAMLSCSLYRFGNIPMKLLLIHDMLRLNPFPLWKVAAFVVILDIAGILFGWGFFAHWAHLAGFATGAAFGYLIFRPPPSIFRKLRAPKRTLH